MPLEGADRTHIVLSLLTKKRIRVNNRNSSWLNAQESIFNRASRDTHTYRCSFEDVGHVQVCEILLIILACSLDRRMPPAHVSQSADHVEQG